VTLLLTLTGFICFIALMAVGVMFSRKPLKGSCGGLAQLDIERECNCKEVCAEHSKTLYQIQEPGHSN